MNLRCDIVRKNDDDYLFCDTFLNHALKLERQREKLTDRERRKQKDTERETGSKTGGERQG